MIAALQQAVGAPSARTAQEVASSLERVLARPEFQPEGEDPLVRALEELLRWGLSDSVLNATSWTLLWIAGIGLGVLLGWLLVRARWLPRSVRASTLAAASPGAPSAQDAAARVAELQARARDARARGDLALALRLSLFALLVGLSRRGDLEFRDAWTHRELFERGRPSPAARAALGPWLGELDAKLFGRAGVVLADLERLDDLSARLLAGGGEGAR